MSEGQIQLEQPQTNKKNIPLIIAVIIVLIVAVTAILYFHSVQQKQEAEKAYRNTYKNTYKKTMKATINDTLTTGAKAEDMFNGYKSVWYDAIWKSKYTLSDGTKYSSIRGFNQAISDQKDVYDELGDISELKEDMSKVDKDMEKLKNPPEQYKDLYKQIVDIYSTLSRFESLAEYPTGSLQSYSDDGSNYDKQLSKSIDSVKVQLPDTTTSSQNQQSSSNKDDLQSYGNQLSPILNNISKILESISNLSNTADNDITVINNSDYMKAVTSVAKESGVLSNEIRNLNIPDDPNATKIQSYLLNVADDLDYLSQNYEKAVATKDETLIKECARRIDDMGNNCTLANKVYKQNK